IRNRPSSADRPHLGPPTPGSNVVKRPKRDAEREDRIHDEAIVDAGPEEQAMSWYYYLEGKISFPFRAKCVAANAVSPLRKGETVEVLRMAAEDACEHDVLVQIRWQGRKMAVPLAQLEAIGADESTQQAIGDWHCWIAQGCILEGVPSLVEGW
ncbi:MAG TPA: calcium-binding protein, partial [Xanthobacteraceae bacterium]